jgi:hypothetical protein
MQERLSTGLRWATADKTHRAHAMHSTVVCLAKLSSRRSLRTNSPVIIRPEAAAAVNVQQTYRQSGHVPDAQSVRCPVTRMLY